MKLAEWIILFFIIFFAVMFAAEVSVRMQQKREEQAMYQLWLQQQAAGNGGTAPAV